MSRTPTHPGWGTGDSAADRYREVVPVVEARTAAQLADFVTTL
ncbi:hypothetical protein [Modestobacter marinus]|nr:hypothetical protein [Modestobacter marinus]